MLKNGYEKEMGDGHKGGLEMTIIRSRMKRKRSLLLFSKAKKYIFLRKKSKTKIEWIKEWGKKKTSRCIQKEVVKAVSSVSVLQAGELCLCLHPAVWCIPGK